MYVEKPRDDVNFLPLHHYDSTVNQREGYEKSYKQIIQEIT